MPLTRDRFRAKLSKALFLLERDDVQGEQHDQESNVMAQLISNPDIFDALCEILAKYGLVEWTP